MLSLKNYEIANIDSTIFAEEPMMGPYVSIIKKNIALLLEIEEEKINVKATRGEGLGYIGRKEGISAEAVVLIKKRMLYKRL
jgi:2-C-methyl-D-erythritol 2,4-cyclodiphosphate synthase